MADQAWRDRMLARGLCNRCGREPIIPGLKYGEACRSSHAQKSTERYNADPEHIAILGRQSRQRLRYEVIQRYGGRCACCGISDDPFLTIDHVNGGGNEHRREIGSRGGNSFYRWLKRQGFPDGYRVLCWNCNAAKAVGICPHQRARYAES